MCEIIESLRSNLVCCNPETNIFTDTASIRECMELLDIFDETALQSGYDAWTFVYFHDKEKWLKSLSSG